MWFVRWSPRGAYLTVFRVAGPVVAAVSVWLSWSWSAAGRIDLDPVLIVGVLAVLALLEGVALAAPVRGSRMEFSALEAGVVLAIFLLPMVTVPAVVALGVTVGQVMRGITLDKVPVNAGVLAVSAVAAAVVAQLLAGREPIDPTAGFGVVTLVTAGVAFGVCNIVLIAALLRVLQRGDAPASLRSWAVEGCVGLVISVALGVLTALVLQVSPFALPILLVPGWLVYRSLSVGGQRAAREASDYLRLQRTVAGAADGICLIDQAASVELVNPAALEMLELTESATVGRSLDELVCLSDPQVGAVFERALRTISADHPGHEFDLPRGDRFLHVEMAGLFEERIPRTGARKVVATGAVVLFRDVTDERHTESLQREFVARVSHELRTPLTAIIGSVHVLKARSEVLEQERRRQLIDMIDRHGMRLQQLVDDLLESARIQAMTITPTPECVDLSSLASLIVDTLRHSYPAADEVHRDISTGVYADREHLERIVTNLLSNALKYGLPPIELRAWRDGSQALIEVSDGGDGVDDDFLPRLFTPFTQASIGDRREASGLGLGLSIVASFVAANGGTIEYLRVERRTCLRVTLAACEPGDSGWQLARDRDGPVQNRSEEGANGSLQPPP